MNESKQKSEAGECSNSVIGHKLFTLAHAYVFLWFRKINLQLSVVQVSIPERVLSWGLRFALERLI